MPVPLVVTHETSPRIAVDVVRNRRFVGGPISGDAGLNCFIEGVEYNPDQASNSGAFITFEWVGERQEVGKFEDPAYKPNVLYDQRPHRAFIPVGTTDHLRLIDLTFAEDSAWSKLVNAPALPNSQEFFSVRAWAKWLAGFRGNWAATEAARVRAELARLVAERPSISIVPHPAAPYRDTFKRRGFL